MVRPKIQRRVRFGAKCDYYKPSGVPVRETEIVELAMDELEAIRLVDAEGLEQKKAASKMKISQPTLNRILALARMQIADALANGKAIKIQGGVYSMPNKDGTGPESKGPLTGRGLGPCGRGEVNRRGRGCGGRN